jgi:hypothetical protein
MSSLALNAWWGSRLETTDACATHLEEMLRRLASLHPIFGRWRRRAKTKSAAQRPFCSMPPVTAELRDIIAKTGERHITGRLLPELGYRFSAWNELDEDHALFFHAKVGEQRDGVGDFNNIFFQLGREGSANRDLLNYGVLKDVLIAVAQSWNADWGTVEPSGYDLRPRDAKGDLIRPWGGWLTYLSPAFATKVTPPAAAVTEHPSNGGLLMAVTKSQFDPSNPAQVAVYNAIQASLRPLQT